MVELRLNTGDWQAYAKDHYISVRVGEVQKLAKLANSRTYKFPTAAVGNRKYGKVELFRRVGSAIVCVDPRMAPGVNEVDVALDVGGEHLKLDAEVWKLGDAKPVTPKKAAPTSPKNMSQKVASYLDEHHLEARLSDAMQAVLREQPKDPAAFLAQHLVGNGDVVAKLPKAAPRDEPKKSQEVPKEEPQLRAQTHEKLAEAEERVSKSAPPQEQAQVPVVVPTKAGTQPLPVEVLPFGQYYAANLAGALPPTSVNLQGKFPRAVGPVEAPAALAVKQLQSSEVTKPMTSFVHRPSMGSYHGGVNRYGGMFKVPAKVATRAIETCAQSVTDLAVKLQPELVLPFGQYYSANFAGHVSPTHVSLNGKFPRALPPQLKVEQSAIVAMPACKVPPGKTGLLPSMGSYQGGVHRFGGMARVAVTSASGPKVEAIVSAKESSEETKPVTSTRFLPSTGSYLGGTVRFGGLVRIAVKLEESISVRLEEKVQEALISTAVEPIRTPSPALFLASAGSFHGGTSRFGGLLRPPLKGTSEPTSVAAVVVEVSEQAKTTVVLACGFLPSAGSYQGGTMRFGGLCRTALQVAVAEPVAETKECVVREIAEACGFLPSAGSYQGGTMRFGGLRRTALQVPVVEPVVETKECVVPEIAEACGFLPSAGSYQGGTMRFGGLRRTALQVPVAEPVAETKECVVREFAEARGFLPSAGSYQGATMRFGGLRRTALQVPVAEPVAETKECVVREIADACGFLPSAGSYQGGTMRFGGLCRTALQVPTVEPVAETKEPAASLVETTRVPVAKLPSVGTWLAARPQGLKIAATPVKSSRPTSSLRRRRPAPAKSSSTEDASPPTPSGQRAAPSTPSGARRRRPSLAGSPTNSEVAARSAA